MYCQRMGSLFRVLINRHSVRAVIPAIGLSFALNEWSDKQWTRQWLGTNTAHMMSSRGYDSSGVSLNSGSGSLQQPTVTPFSDNWFEPFVTIYPMYEKTGHNQHNVTPLVLGSGFIISERGYVLTQYGVYGGFTRFVIRLGSGREVIGKHCFHNIDIGVAVIRLDGRRDDWPVVVVAQPHQMVITRFRRVLVPSVFIHGLYNQLTDGMVTNPHRKGEDIPFLKGRNDFVTQSHYIQHSAKIMAKNMGSAVVDTGGSVIAMNWVFHANQHIIAYPIHQILNNLNENAFSIDREDGPLLKGIFRPLADVRNQLVAEHPELQLPADGIVYWEPLDNQLDILEIILKLNQYDVITRINGVDAHNMDVLYEAMDDFKNNFKFTIELNGGRRHIDFNNQLLNTLFYFRGNSTSTDVCV